jgi:hypothetical protein
MLVRQVTMPLVNKFHLGTSPTLHFLVSLVPWGRMRLLQQKIDIMHKTSVDIFNAKKRSILNEGDTNQVDFLSILS